MSEPWELTPEQIGTEYGKWIKDDGENYNFDLWLAHAAAVHAREVTWKEDGMAKAYYLDALAGAQVIRQQAFKEVGEWLDKKPRHEFQGIAEYVAILESEIAALKAGRVAHGA